MEKELEAWIEHKRYVGMSEEAKSKTDAAKWTPWLERYAERLAQSAPAVGSAAAGSSDAERIELMAAANPQFVLRNYLCQIAIRAAEDGDFGEAQALLKRVQDPFGKDSSVSSALSETALEYQRAGKVRGGNLVELGDAPPATATTAKTATTAAAASCAVGGAEALERSPAVAEAYNSMPPKWACKLRVSCSS